MNYLICKLSKIKPLNYFIVTYTKTRKTTKTGCLKNWFNPYRISQVYVNLTIPNSVERCTFEEFWSRVVDYLCTASVSQPYVDAIITTDPVCTPLARHYASYCGRGNGKYCLDILQGLFPLVNPTQTAFVNPFWKMTHLNAPITHLLHRTCALHLAKAH